MKTHLAPETTAGPDRTSSADPACGTTGTVCAEDTHLRRIARPRADYLRNRERIVTAARDVFVEQGPEAPLDEIARRAGVGNATLYRHFPDRESLIRDVVLHVTIRTADLAEQVAASETDTFTALSVFVHRAADERIGVVCPLLCGTCDKGATEQLTKERDRFLTSVDALIKRAQAADRLRQDVSLGDVMVAITQLCRPLPGHVSPDIDRFTHRHLQLFLDGLEGPGHSELPGRAATLEDLRRKASMARP